MAVSLRKQSRNDAILIEKTRIYCTNSFDTTGVAAYHTRPMSSGRLHTREVVDAMVLAARGENLTHSFPLSELLRLAEQSKGPELASGAELSTGTGSQAHLHARFHVVDGRCAVAGQVTASLHAICQRCLQPMRLAVEDRFHVVLVRSEAEMSELPEAQDSVIANAEQLDLKWLTEEQLLLAVPLVPLHADAEECESAVRDQDSIPVDKRNTPFAQLRELLKK